MPDEIALPGKYLDRLKDILSRHVPDVEVLAYGSRVTGGGHDTSDLDIALRAADGKKIPADVLFSLQDALTENDIPILVRPFDWARIPESFRREISRRNVVIQRQPGV